MPQDTPTIQPNGPAWAALLAAALGGLAFGVLTDISEVSKSAAAHLLWYPPAGALSGVALAAVAIWLVKWAVLHVLWKNKHIKNQQPLLIAIGLLILAAIITTFPPFYELLGG
jgi:H+/Cl- antiporter ClcA